MDAPIFYLWIYRKIRKKADGRVIVPYAMILEIIKRSIPWTPRAIYYPIIKDMEKSKLLKRMDKRRYEIIGGNADSLLNQYNCPI
jgi:hypothetical protein